MLNDFIEKFTNPQ